MSKVTGAYDSLIKGVSEQVAHQRFPGQHWDQLNTVSDPVRGLARRAGSVMIAERSVAATLLTEATLADCRYFREQSVYLGVTEYSISYRSQAKPSGSTMPGLTCLDKTNGVLLPVSYTPSDTDLIDALDLGINSITSVGNFILMAVKGKATTYTQKDLVSDNVIGTRQTANSAVAWIKGGSYSRTYTVAVKAAANNTVYTVQYTTPGSYYPGTLDTSDIPATVSDGSGGTKANPDYQKLVNDRVYAYQTAVNQWISTSAAAIQPTNIAQQLLQLLVAAVPTGAAMTFSRTGSHVVIDGASSISVDDGGDGSQAVGVARIVKQASDLSTIHVPGKVVKIQPQSGSAKSYYVQAVAKVAGTTDFGEVTWEEAPGILLTPVFVCLMGCVKDGQLWVASSPALLSALADVTVPPWEPSSSGDLESQPLPAFLGAEIHYLRMYQDRLFIVHNATVFMSRSGDYFNFFRVSALTVQDNDPIEVYALGSEDDVISSGTLLDRNLILFGKQWQYAVPGRDAITPTTAFVAVQSGYKDTNDCAPETSGNLIFFTQQRDGKLTVQQMQTGAYADTLTAFEVTQQLNSFLHGRAQQIVSVTSPSAVFMRTADEDHGFWVYSYLDNAGNTERLFDSWSKWNFNPALGNIVSMTSKDGFLLVTTLRGTTNGAYLVTDRFTLYTDPNAPHLDSRRPYGTAGTLRADLVMSDDPYAGAYTEASGRYYLVGDTYADDRLTELRNQVGTEQDANLVVGALYDAYTVITNPYMRDQDGKAILDGRLTLGNLNVSVFEASAMDVSICDLVNEDTDYVVTQRWTARAVNAWVLNTQTVTNTTSVLVGVYKEIRDCKVRLASRSWLPLTISSIEWAGQFFTRRRG